MGATLTNSLSSLFFVRTTGLRNSRTGNELLRGFDSPRRCAPKMWASITDAAEQCVMPPGSAPSQTRLISRAKLERFRITFTDGKVVNVDGVELGRGKMAATLDQLKKRHGNVCTVTKLS